MDLNYQYSIVNPQTDCLGYIIAIANVKDKHDRSAPSDYHWKILKCRMILFSNSSILACPDKKDLKQVHIIFNKVGDDYDKLTSLFLQFSLVQTARVSCGAVVSRAVVYAKTHFKESKIIFIPHLLRKYVDTYARTCQKDGPIRKTTTEIFQTCFDYTMTAKMAPVWNTLGYNYLVNNRDFLTSKGPEEGLEYRVWSNDHTTVIELKPVKINLMRSNEDFLPGEWVRVLPSLNKAIVEDYWACLPDKGNFKSYKDLRRHWKNIHGYRLPEEECPYYSVQFWRGEPLTYPKICVVRNFPIVTPVPKSTEKIVLTRFLNCLKNKMPYFLGVPLTIQCCDNNLPKQVICEKFSETQAVSLCTPTQHNRST